MAAACEERRTLFRGLAIVPAMGVDAGAATLDVLRAAGADVIDPVRGRRDGRHGGSALRGLTPRPQRVSDTELGARLEQARETGHRLLALVSSSSLPSRPAGRAEVGAPSQPAGATVGDTAPSPQEEARQWARLRTQGVTRYGSTSALLLKLWHAQAVGEGDLAMTANTPGAAAHGAPSLQRHTTTAADSAAGSAVTVTPRRATPQRAASEAVSRREAAPRAEAGRASIRKRARPQDSDEAATPAPATSRARRQTPFRSSETPAPSPAAPDAPASAEADWLACEPSQGSAGGADCCVEVPLEPGEAGEVAEPAAGAVAGDLASRRAASPPRAPLPQAAEPAPWICTQQELQSGEEGSPGESLAVVERFPLPDTASAAPTDAGAGTRPAGAATAAAAATGEGDEGAGEGSDQHMRRRQFRKNRVLGVNDGREAASVRCSAVGYVRQNEETHRLGAELGEEEREEQEVEEAFDQAAAGLRAPVRRRARRGAATAAHSEAQEGESTLFDFGVRQAPQAAADGALQRRRRKRTARG